MKRLLSWIRDGWLIFGVTLALILIVDGVLKSVLPERTGWTTLVAGAQAPDRQATEVFDGVGWADRHFRELKQARHMHWTPYTYWSRRPFQGETIQIDEDGRRKTWTPDAAPLATIWVFGGSTVWGTGARDDYTLPSALARALDASGRPVRVVNQGESGYVSTQGLIRLQRLLQSGERPDVVVFYDGVNDVFAALQSGIAGIPQNESERIKDFRASYGLDNWLATFPDTLEGVQRLATGESIPPSPALGAAVAAAWAANAATVRAMGEAYGFTSLFFWQPSIFSKTPLSASEQAIHDASLIAHRDLQRAADAAVMELAMAGADRLSLSELFQEAPEPLFMDFCHLSEAGNRRVAEAMLPRLTTTLDQRMAPSDS